MPGFQFPERLVTLVFDKGPLLGLELTVRLNVPFDFRFELIQMIAPTPERKVNGASVAEIAEHTRQDLEAHREQMQRFAAEALVGWNLEDRNGDPVPCTPEAFTQHVDALSFGAMLGRYLSAIGGVPGPLAPRSANGSTSKVRRASSRRPSSSKR